jgi:hypothetical protein
MLVLLSALAAAAQAPATAPVEKTDDPIICTRQNTGDEVGTRLQRKKICMKKSERDIIQRNTDQTLQQYLNNGNDRSRYIPPPPH